MKGRTEQNEVTMSGKDKSLVVDPKTRAVLEHKGYDVYKMISEGAFGQVYKAKNVNRDQMDAVKVMHLAAMEAKGLKKKFVDREIAALTAVRHPNVLKVNDIFRSGGRLYIFMEFAPNGTLIDKLRKAPNKCFSESTAKRYFKQCIDALVCMHVEHKMAHRDIKLENVLLDQKWNAKLSDFGFARDWGGVGSGERLSTTFCGTEPYYAPEIVAKRPYNPFLYDVWSMGVMLFIMLNGKFPFHWKEVKKNPQIMLTEMKAKAYEYCSKVEDILSDEVKQLISWILTFNPNDRPNIIGVRTHAWLHDDD